MLSCTLFQENLVGERGLVPGTEQQTFQVTIPKKLRNEYNKVLLRVSLAQVRSTISI